MFFTLSKLGWMVAAPSGLLVLCVALAAATGAVSGGPRARKVAGVLAGLLAICAFSPVGALLTRPLEDRFPRAPADLAAPTGILVLGGSVDETIGAARGQVTLTEAASRLTEGVALARRFPMARLVFTGGSAAIVPRGETEAAAALRLWTDLGVPPERITLEDRSRDTWENATLTQALVAPKPGERWLLVTSAQHMPRAMGIFRRVGWPMIPYPVDYRTSGGWSDWRPSHEASGGLARLDAAVHEWIGLVAYRLTDRTDALFPAPDEAESGSAR